MSRYESTIFHHRSLPKDAIYARYTTSTMDFRRTLRSWSNNISQGSQRRIRAQSQGVLFQQTKQQRLEVRIFLNLPLVSIKRLIHLLGNRLIKQTLTVHWQRLLTKLIKVNWGARSKDFKLNASLIETQSIWRSSPWCSKTIREVCVCPPSTTTVRLVAKPASWWAALHRCPTSSPSSNAKKSTRLQTF